MKKRVTRICILTICIIPLACGQQNLAASVLASTPAQSLQSHAHLPVLPSILSGTDSAILSLPSIKNSSPWSELPGIITPDTNTLDTSDTKETEQENGTPLNESGSLSDLDYPFQKEYTDRSVLVALVAPAEADKELEDHSCYCNWSNEKYNRLAHSSGNPD